VAAEEAAAAQPPEAAAGDGAIGSDSKPALPALRLVPPPAADGAVEARLATSIATLPSSAPHESLTPTMGYNAQQADENSASAYAVTALADAIVDGAADSVSEHQAAAAAQSSAALQAVDWQKVAEQADSHAAAAALHPQGSVARLRAIFEQQSGCDAYPDNSLPAVRSGVLRLHLAARHNAATSWITNLVSSAH
jgi:small-conductance mechanosensitive channel